MGQIQSLPDVKSKLSEWAAVPMIECNRYTITSKESISVRGYSTDSISIAIKGPGIKNQKSLTTDKKGNLYTTCFRPTQKGEYKITVTTRSGKTAEARIFVRQPWSWYMKNARDFVAENQPLFSNACETFYGYYTAFLAAKHFPDTAKDNALQERFDNTLPLIIDTTTWLPNPKSLPHRIQNFSALMGMLVDLWEYTGEKHYLEKAAHIADYLCSDKIQGPDGAYRSQGTHYTAVIYTAKSMLELVAAEEKLIANPVWKERHERHLNSARKAVDDLCGRLDDIETEGDMTFEDGMITCSALQLGMYGLQTTEPSQQKKYSEAARYLMDKHKCLEQLLIPDCRMRGATLRYWEALDVYFIPNQAMNSPHGWTAWKIYASYYLYLLTGEEFYLTDFMDTLGACAQIMREDGHLRWGFIPDPYIEAKLYVENPEQKHHGLVVDSIVGEQYLDMISPWLRPDDENTICQFKERGGAGDNTVQEIFKVMEECALTSAYVLIRKDGSILAYNCQVHKKNGTLHIIPDEAIIIATIMAIGGVYLLSGSEGGTLNSTGLALALTTVLTYASYIVGINKSSVSDMDGLKLTFYVLLSGAFIFLLNLIVNREMLTPIPSWEIGVDLILLALVPTLISDLTLILAVQHVGSTTTAVLGCMEPLTAVIMGVLFLGESCNFIQSIGICIILIAVTTVIIARNPHEIKKGLQLIPKLLHKSRVK